MPIRNKNRIARKHTARLDFTPLSRNPADELAVKVLINCSSRGRLTHTGFLNATRKSSKERQLVLESLKTLSENQEVRKLFPNIDHEITNIEKARRKDTKTLKRLRLMNRQRQLNLLKLRLISYHRQLNSLNKKRL